MSSNGPSTCPKKEVTRGGDTLDTGSTGLQHFDKLVSLAEQTGVKLIVTLTNNWADYGGMDVYTINLGGQYHDEFYYNPKIVSAFKNYVKTIVTRYKNSPAVFAWELANEPRCGADSTRNLPRSPSGCNTTVLTNWANDISTYIKSLDRNHLVTLGDEGFFLDPSNTDGDWAYTGADGVDFVSNLKLKHLDFGTFHLYPDWCVFLVYKNFNERKLTSSSCERWSKTVDWANQYVKDHATAQRTVGKPVIMEEYGWLSVAGRLQNLGTTSNYTRVEVEGGWQKIAVEEKLAGDLFWQFGLEKGLSTGISTDVSCSCVWAGRSVVNLLHLSGRLYDILGEHNRICTSCLSARRCSQQAQLVKTCPVLLLSQEKKEGN